MALALPVAIVTLPRLASHTIQQWLRRRGIPVSVPQGHRDLMGCIVARCGYALILVPGTDPEEERRFTVAHEVAHLIVHYLLPRGVLIAALGEGIVDVLDGHRPPTLAERATAALSALHLGPHVHLMPRHGPGAGTVLRFEDEADELALELLAPCEAIEAALRSVEVARLDGAARCGALGARFGVPPYVFQEVVEARRPRPGSFLEEAMSLLREKQP
ncbi:MAG TPA: ImmA/IrrE family metallo-endopeptidase [Longimicrobiaceae bacterium]|nr:ImmA/IrrE family metallo-endopeptidase [Longimicrobiaceae bacterium]